MGRLLGEGQLTLFDGVRIEGRVSDEWYTPRWVFTAAGLTFDLDVAAPENSDLRTCPARRYFTVADNGLEQDWEGTVWCNPPYSRATPWVERWAAHPDGLILLPAVTQSYWLGQVMRAAQTFTLLGQLDFLLPPNIITNGRPGVARIRWPNVLAGRGRCARAVEQVAAADKYAGGGFLIGAGV